MTNKCGHDGCEQRGKNLCAACAEVTYCSKDCQKAAWPTHKLVCKKAALVQETASLQQSFKDMSVTQLKNLLKTKMFRTPGISENKRKLVLSQMEMAIEKPALLRLVQEHIDPSEIETLLSNSGSAQVASTTGSSSSSGRRVGNGHQRTAGMGGRGMPASNPTMPSPDVIRENIKKIRKNPDALRRAQPAQFGHMTDAEILKQVDMMEEAAKNPESLKEMMKHTDKVSKMAPDLQRKYLVFQEGLQNKVPKDAKWIEAAVDVVQKSPDLLKAMLGMRPAADAVAGKQTVSNEQLEGLIDWLAAMEPMYLRVILTWILWLMEKYTVVDNATFGCGKYVVLALALVLLYLLFKIVMFFARIVYVVLSTGYNLAFPASASASTTSSASFPAAAKATISSGTTLLQSKASEVAKAAAASAASASAAAASAAAASAAAATFAAAAVAAANTNANVKDGGPLEGLKDKVGGMFAGLMGDKGNKKGGDKSEGAGFGAPRSRSTNSMDSEF